MNMKDMHSNLAAVHAIAAQVVTSTGGAVDSGDIDLEGFLAAEVLVNFGANGGDTLSGANYFTVKIEHADDDGEGSAEDYAACESKDVLGLTPSSGVVVIVDDAAEDDLTYNFGYVGGKRFVKMTVTPEGTLENGNPVAVNVVKGRPSQFPVS